MLVDGGGRRAGSDPAARRLESLAGAEAAARQLQRVVARRSQRQSLALRGAIGRVGGGFTSSTRRQRSDGACEGDVLTGSPCDNLEPRFGSSSRASVEIVIVVDRAGIEAVENVAPT